MTYQEPLSKRCVAVSISESPDMAPLGLGTEHLTDVMTEVARHLLALGSRLLYGGDLRPDTDDRPGFTRILFELVSRHRRDADLGDERPALLNVLAWPVIQDRVPPPTIAEYQEQLRGLVQFVTLDPEGRPVPLTELLRTRPTAPLTDAEWSLGLSAMRDWSTRYTDARVVLGGRVTGYKGRMPGVAEEALYSLQLGRPLFLVGGFGGCARDVAVALGLLDATASEWPGVENFNRGQFDASSLNNGLTAEENATLASTPHVDEVAALILRGLIHLFGDDQADSSRL